MQNIGAQGVSFNLRISRTVRAMSVCFENWLFKKCQVWSSSNTKYTIYRMIRQVWVNTYSEYIETCKVGNEVHKSKYMKVYNVN